MNLFWSKIGVDTINKRARHALTTMTPQQIYEKEPVLVGDDCPVNYKIIIFIHRFGIVDML